MNDAQGAVLEIIERRKAPIGDSPAETLIAPNEVRINGQKLLCPRDHPVQVHDITINDGELVQVTLTMFARRVEIGVEASDGK